MDRRIDAHIARTQFGQIMDLATKNNERFIVDRRGEPAVVIMSVQDFIRTTSPAPDGWRKPGPAPSSAGSTSWRQPRSTSRSAWANETSERANKLGSWILSWQSGRSWCFCNPAADDCRHLLPLRPVSSTKSLRAVNRFAWALHRMHGQRRHL
jgi:hypothetical protein